MCARRAGPRAVRRRSCELEGETCARKHEQIEADGEFVVVHRRFSGPPLTHGSVADCNCHWSGSRYGSTESKGGRGVKFGTPLVVRACLALATFGVAT
jgi:hypothetical protein